MHAHGRAGGSGLGPKLVLPFRGDAEVWGGEVVQTCRQQPSTIRRRQHLRCKALWETYPPPQTHFP